MKLSRLMEALHGSCEMNGGTQTRKRAGAKANRGDTDIGSIHYRAQEVRPGGLFIAVEGASADGHDFIDAAWERGAAAVVVQKAVPTTGLTLRVPDTRRAMGTLAACFYGYPADQLCMIGITGTNGKTTTAYLIESILAAGGHRVGVLGTINCRFAGHTLPSPVTTPESVDLQRMLSEMRTAGVTHAVMEVSSHGLFQQRIRGCRYDVAVFTNLSQDHLDFHGTLEDYWRCKQTLFTQYLRPGGRAVVNAEDARGRELIHRLGGNADAVGKAEGCRVRAANDRYDLTGLWADITVSGECIRCRSPLVGRHNLENILCAAGAATAAGLSARTIEKGIRQLLAVPGRLEPIPNNRERFVFVDYAHTPDALEKALTGLRAVTHGRIICVFGCGGDRDRGKRPQMGRIAVAGSELAIVTSDNPRSEDPLAIIGGILDGLKGDAGKRYAPDALREGFHDKGYAVEADRRRAIELAVAASAPGDTILIAGKGHETYQILGKRTIDFDDRKVAGQALDTFGQDRNGENG